MIEIGKPSVSTFISQLFFIQRTISHSFPLVRDISPVPACLNMSQSKKTKSRRSMVQQALVTRLRRRSSVAKTSPGKHLDFLFLMYNKPSLEVDVVILLTSPSRLQRIPQNRLKPRQLDRTACNMAVEKKQGSIPPQSRKYGRRSTLT